MRSDLKFKLEHIPSTVVLAQVFLITCFICYYFVFNGIAQKERDLIESIRPGNQIILAQSDNRRKNVFYSTPEFYYSLKNNMPNISILLGLDHPIEYKIKDGQSYKNIKRNVGILLVDDNFFKMVNGDLISGQEISLDDFQSGRPVAILTEGLRDELYPQNNNGYEITVNGTSFFVKGTWGNHSINIKENYSLLLPISAINILGIPDKTYINRFILKGKGSKELEKLKQAIDTIQLNAGFTPIRPEYSILNLKLSERYLSIVNNQKVYIDVTLWILSLAVAILFYQDLRNRLFIFNDWLLFRLMCKHPRSDIQMELSKLLGVLILSITTLSCLLSFIILALLYFVFKTPLGVGSYAHLGVLVIIAAYLLLFLESKRIVKNAKILMTQN